MPVIEGGTGQTSLTFHGVLLGGASGPLGITAVGTNGQVLTGVTGSDPVWSSTLITDSGTFVPTWFGSTTSGITTYNVQQGYYNRIGDTIFASAYLDIASATGTGSATLGGLPFTISGATNYFPTSVLVQTTSGAPFGLIGTAGTVNSTAIQLSATLASNEIYSYTLIYNM